MICRRPEILEIGLAKLKEEQEIFADAAKIIDPNKSPAEVFKQIQKEHPNAENLIPDIAKNLDQIRGYVTEHKIVGIPPNAKAQVKETPQYDRATSFASMDTPGPFEKKATEAFYYVTPVEPDVDSSSKRKNGLLHLTTTRRTSPRFTKLILDIMCNFCG